MIRIPLTYNKHCTNIWKQVHLEREFDTLMKTRQPEQHAKKGHLVSRLELDNMHLLRKDGNCNTS